MNRVRIGMVGCGGVLRVMFGPIFRFLDNAEFVAGADPDPVGLDLAKHYGARQTFTDYDRFLAEADIDAVIVGSPVYLHAEQVIAAARAGKHVFCEKPMARTVAECDAMIEACQAAGVTLMVGFMKRFDKTYRYAKQLIDRGDLGQITQVWWDWSWYQYDNVGGWRDSLPTLGGVFQDHGSHTIDLCRWWAGDIRTVSAEADMWIEGREVEDYVAATFRHASRAVSVHHHSRLTHRANREWCMIDGEYGSLEFCYGPPASFAVAEPIRLRLYEKGQRVTDITPYPTSVWEEEQRRHGRYKLELEHFCQSILDGTEPVATGADGRAAIEAINAVYWSAFTGEKVHLPLTERVDLERLFTEMGKRPRLKLQPAQ